MQFIVQRGIEIISEASRRLPPELKATRPEIRWPSIAGIGNVIRPKYHTIADKIIWDVVQELAGVADRDRSNGGQPQEMIAVGAVGVV